MIWRTEPVRRPPTQAEITALRALPRQRGGPLNAALLALVDDHSVEQKSLARALGLTTSALSTRLRLARAREDTAAETDAFTTQLDSARAYFHQHGHLLPPATEGALSSWLTKQRRARATGRLTDEQIAALDELGMDWAPAESRWQKSLDAARRYRNQHGHLRPSVGDTIDGLDLHVWVNRQRTAYREGKLAPDRIAALEDLGIDWTPNRGLADVRAEAAWHARLEDARQFHAAHGHLSPASGTVVNGRRLDAWLSVQRARHRDGRLTDEQTAALEALGIRWSPGPLSY
ncbi:hypothetical protein CLM62_47140 [Streptomyces sp. SA15]|uniref:helicase associated domain-containing protein n=1 Tax=Streptomyces sp. SA15 TaxID=934019 RepID=UPI000BB0982B|nr:helicase associated domain-containing protein [Streptomyces sp. SA15]PAZ09338.1 hypothetical protein CLM62_47140 [Streptomyces sp. SA15]